MSNVGNNRNKYKTGERGRALIVAIAIFSVILVLALGTLYSCMSNYSPDMSVEEIKAYIEEHPGSSNATTVEEVLRSWPLPSFKRDLLLGVERCYALYYYKDLPASAELAYDTAMYFIDNLYTEVDKSDATAVAYALIDSYIYAIGDPYSYYRTAEEFKEYETDMSGQFAGIGVSVETSLSNGGILVINTISDSPAETAGILPGDLIIKVNGSLVADIGYDAAVSQIKGEIGTSVTVTVKRGDTEFDLDIVRALVTEQSVGYTMLEGNVAYIRITSFKGNTAEQFCEAIDLAESDGAVGIIFDLCNNPGGYLTAICDSLSYLVPNGTPLASFSSDKTPVSASDGTDLEPTDHVITVPCAVLCNRYTASAGELFTAALRDFNEMGLIRAVTVGETTYKKGVMQSSFTFQSGAALTLTTAYYNPPLGVNYDGVGVIPDVQPDEGADIIAEALNALEALISEAD